MTAGFLAVAARHTSSHDAVFGDASRELLRIFAMVFGIPLSFLALLTGVLLGLSTRWGVLRYPWVMVNLGLIVTVILNGALVFRPLLFGAVVANGTLIVGASYNVAALMAATILSVFKPGRRFSMRRVGADPAAAASPRYARTEGR